MANELPEILSSEEVYAGRLIRVVRDTVHEGGKTYFREVDGVRLPFRVRDDFAVITYDEVKHNAAVEDARFAEEKDCFTR